MRNNYEETHVQTTDVAVIVQAPSSDVAEILAEIPVEDEAAIESSEIDPALPEVVDTVAILVPRPRRPAHLRLVHPGRATGPGAAPQIMARAHVAAAPGPVLVWGETPTESRLKVVTAWMGAGALALLTVAVHFLLATGGL